MTWLKRAVVCVPLSALGLSANGAPAPAPASNPDRDVYFGDLHLHTAYSFDAYLSGTRIGPNEAYRFARGETVMMAGRPMRRAWPLDFLAVSDHTENLGIGATFADPDSPFSQSEAGKQYAQDPNDILPIIVELYRKTLDSQRAASAWAEEIAAANRNYRPGSFTTFIGYEWASETWTEHEKVSREIHRNVIFKGDTAPAPFTTIDSKEPEALWAYMERNRARGIESLAITNHPNISKGSSYDLNRSDGRPIDAAYARRRALNEPLSEIFQLTGSSETSPDLSPQDKDAGFGLATTSTLAHGSAVREAWGRGIALESKFGVNPFKFGVVGTSDTHAGLSTSEPEIYGHIVKIFAQQAHIELASLLSASTPGLTGVWAQSNTRESIFDALRRREVFATSGTRLRLRFFAGWDYTEELPGQKHWLTDAYARGVPMGADLPVPKGSKGTPRFLVWASRAPQGAFLERAQIIKVWVKNGERSEKVFDVAVAGRPQGVPELRAIWRDPEFDPTSKAIYYLRVLEVPTPRWSTLLAQREGIILPDNLPTTEPQRAWSSPIWIFP